MNLHNMINKNINKYLPHKYPFLFIDKVINFKQYSYILTTKNITISEFYFQGHFPTQPILPGVIIIEALAQTSGLLINLSLNITTDYPNFYLGSVDKTKFKKIVLPGSKLYLESKIINKKNLLWKFSCKAFLDGFIICSSILTCVKNYDIHR